MRAARLSQLPGSAQDPAAAAAAKRNPFGQAGGGGRDAAAWLKKLRPPNRRGGPPAPAAMAELSKICASWLLVSDSRVDTCRQTCQCCRGLGLTQVLPSAHRRSQSITQKHAARVFNVWTAAVYEASVRACCTPWPYASVMPSASNTNRR